MMKSFNLGQQVKLKSFLGTIHAPESTVRSEDFWQLVGECGEIASDVLKIHPAFPDKGARVLVRFYINIDDLGLPNHNEINNSLWIFVSDLEEFS